MISVIVPIYNSEKYLKECIQSLLAQTHPDFELICIDDGSTDNSYLILQEFAQKDERIHIYTQENCGISATRNRGIGLAQGEYLMFIDSDDTTNSEMLELLYKQAIEDDLDVVVCDFYEYVEATKVRTKNTLPSFFPTSIKEKPQLLFEINSSPWNKLYRTSLWHGIRFPQNTKYEDAYAVLVALMKAHRIGKVNAYLLDYWIHEGSETTVVDARVFDIFDILTMLKDYAVSCGFYDTIKSYIEYFAINRITVYMLQQVYQRDKENIALFVQKGYDYLDTQYPGWRRNEHFCSANGLLKYYIKTRSVFMRIYIALMRKK